MKWSRALRFAGLFLVFLATAAPAQTTSPATQDIWNAAQLQGAHAGYVHTRISQIHHGDQVLIRTITELNLTIRRYERVIQLRMETGSEETPEGKVTSVSMKQYQGNQQYLVMTGTVQQGQLQLRVRDTSRNIPWDDRVIGLYRQERILHDRQVKPGERFSYLSFEPTIANIVMNRVSVKDYEEILVPEKGKMRLLRVESVPDKIAIPGGEVQLPGLVSWIDDRGLSQKSEFELPDLGTLVLFRTNESTARAPRNIAELPSLNSLVPLAHGIEHANDSKTAVYRITVKGDHNPSGAFALDSRQSASHVTGSTFELRVGGYPAALPGANPGSPKEEFLKNSYFIDCDDRRIRALAGEAVGQERDTLRKGLLVEKWVHHNMQVSFAESFAPASTVAKSMKGDCRQHALLTAAICRAAGVPARTAIGLCYAHDPKVGPAMAFHMWTEIWADGRWIGIDATRGQGHVGATHLKITDSSWSNTQSLAPLLPVLRVLGKLSIEVVSVD